MAFAVALDDAAWASPWRRVRVGEKLLLGGGLLLTALLAPPWPAAPLVALTAVIAAIRWARIPARVLALGFAAPAAFIVVGVVSVAIRVGGPAPDALATLGPLSLDAASVTTAATVLGRSCAGTLAVLLIATTTPMVDLLAWTRRRGVPGPLVEVASLVYRLLFVLLATAVAITTAQKARLADAPGGGWAGVRRRFGHVGTALGALLIRSWDRASRLTHGLEARGLDGDLPTLAPTTPASPTFLTASALALAAIWTAVALHAGVAP